MEPHSEHAFYAWLIIIGAVCVAILIGAIIDRFFLNRRLGQLRNCSAPARADSADTRISRK